jgi:hypothetical protein
MILSEWTCSLEGEVIEETGFFRHVRFSRPLQVLMDGRKGMAVI